MYRGLVLINHYSKLESQERQSRRLIEELERLGAHMTLRRVDLGEIIMSDGKLDNSFNDIDFVIYFDKDKYLIRLLEKAGIRVFNKAEALETCDDKVLTHIALSNHNIPMPKTIPGLLCYDKDAVIREDSVDKVIDELGLPLVIKESYGSLGKGVYLVTTRDELKCKMDELKLVPHLYQEYIESSKGVDIRVLVIGGKVIASMKRVSTTDFRSNIELGGIGEPINPPKAYLDLAIKVASTLNLDYCGIDFLIGRDGNPLVSEVNSNAFFNELEKVSKVNVARAYAEYILERMKEKD